MENEEIVVEMATDEADFQLEIPSVSTVLVEEVISVFFLKIINFLSLKCN